MCNAIDARSTQFFYSVDSSPQDTPQGKRIPSNLKKISKETLKKIQTGVPIAIPELVTPEVAIQNTAQQVFLELSLAIALNVGVMSYQLKTHQFVILSFSQVVKSAFLVAHPLIPIMTVILSVAFLGLLTLRVIQGPFHLKQLSGLEKVQKLARFSLITTSFLGGETPLIHEMGHYVAANVLFKNADAALSIFSFKGGETSYAVSYGLTKIGEVFGKHKAILTVTAAGALASTVFGIIELSVASLIEEKLPKLSQALKFHAVAQTLSDFIYGLTAFFIHRPNLANDFVRLWLTGGIHPIIPMAFLAIVPLLSITA